MTNTVSVRGCAISVIPQFGAGELHGRTATRAILNEVGKTDSRALNHLPPLALALDLFLITVSSVVAFAVSESLGQVQTELHSGTAVDLPAVTTATALVWVTLIGFSRGYSRNVFGVGTDEFKSVLNASMLTAGVVGVGCYLLRSHLPRGLFVLAFAIGVPLLLVGRFILRRSLQRARASGALQMRVLVVGTASHVDEVTTVLNREAWMGYDVIGALTPTGRAAHTPSGLPILGGTEQVAASAAEAGADVVLLAGGAVESAAQLRQIAWDLEHEDMQVIVAPSVTDVSGERVRARPVGGLPLIHLEKPRAVAACRSAKRSFDLVASSCLLVLVSPLLLYFAARVRLHDRGPVLFRQRRIGRDGVSFDRLKFRTMGTDAKGRQPRIPAQRGSAPTPAQMAPDPRLTAPGRRLRRYSLDGLPQLFNVLLGDMSLVGPRPPLQSEVDQYDHDMARRLRVRPGITGLWQVSNRSDLTRSEAIRLDLYYVDNWSMVQDLSILARTVGAVVGPRGDC